MGKVVCFKLAEAFIYDQNNADLLNYNLMT